MICDIDHDRHWGALEGELIVLGQPDSSFGQPIAADVAAHHVIDTPERHRTKPSDHTTLKAPTARLAGPQPAPGSFGPLAGKRFFCQGGSTTGTNSDNTTHVFAEQLQTDAAALIFQNDRMIVSLVRMSYSTGEFHDPDGSLYEITNDG